MMKSNKGKTNFWSQLLLSMIAIFALPVAQGLEAPPSSNMSGENYQTSSEQHMLIAVREIRQALQVQPHFIAAEFPVFAPIRAGPAII